MEGTGHRAGGTEHPMEGLGHPGYPVKDGRPARAPEELRTDEHFVALPDEHHVLSREGFLHDAVEVLDPRAIDRYPSMGRATEALGLRGDYEEETAETVRRCLEAKQAQLEAQGFAAIKHGPIGERVDAAIHRMDFADEQLLLAYANPEDGAPSLDDEDAMGELAAGLGMDVRSFKQQLRKSVRRLAAALDG